MKRIGLVVGLALVGFACAEGVGQVLEDAGGMLADAGESMQDGSVPDAGAQDETATCSKSSTQPWSTGTATFRWAQFEVDPGQTEVTACWGASDVYNGLQGQSDTCSRSKAAWIRGTSTGFVPCGHRYVDGDGAVVQEIPDPISITVHR